jgi:gliding motility-associated-like protein
MITKLKHIFFILIGYFFISMSLQAQTLYFKCTSGSASNYNWSTLANWYTDAACTVAAPAIPGSGNDVIIGANTFTTNGQRVVFDQTAMACKGFSVTYAGTYTNCALTSAIGNKLSVFGHFDFTGFDNTKLSITGWNGDVELNPANIGTLNVLTDKKALYVNRLIIPGNTAQYTVNFNDSIFMNRSNAVLNLGQIIIAPSYTSASSVRVNFNDLVKLGYRPADNNSAELIVNSGTVFFNNGVFSTVSNLSGVDVVASGGASNGYTGGIRALNSSSVTLLPNLQRGRSEMYSLWLSGTSTTNHPKFNAANQVIKTNSAMLFDYCNADFTNSTLNACNYIYTGTAAQRSYWAAKTTATIALTGSTLNIGESTASSFASISYASLDYNVVNINQSVVYGQSLNGNFQFVPSSNPKFNQFNVNNATFLIGQSNGTPVYTIKPGGIFYMAPGSGFMGASGSAHTFSISSTATVSLVGTCSKPILFNNFNINFSTMPPTNLTADYLLLHGSIATGTSTPYNAGANSLKIYNTNTTGWTVACMPSARTVYWQGPLAGGNWSNPNNWSLISSASPSTPTTAITSGACLPTYQDSVIFPDQSQVSIDLTRVYTKSVRIVATATLNAVPVFLSSSDCSWLVSGGWWATNKFKNSYNGQVIFNTFEYPHLIKTGGVPFGGSGARYPISFNGAYPPNGSCGADNTKHKGGWLILDTLATVAGGNYGGLYINSGVFKTYSAEPLYNSYYPSTQKKGSVLIAYASGGTFSMGSVDTKDTVSLYDSDIYLFMGSGSNSIAQVTIPNRQLNEGTAEFICYTPSNYPAFSMSAGNRLNEITVKTFGYLSNVSNNQMAIQNISQSGSMGGAMRLAMNNDTVDVINNYQGLVISPANNLAGVTRKITSINSNAGCYLEFNSASYGTMLNYFIDTLYTNSPTNIVNSVNTHSVNFTIGKLMHINGGGVTLKMGNSNAAQFNNNATITFSNNATFISDGTCNNRNFITSYTPLGTATAFSKMILLGTINQTLTATDVQDNIVMGGTLNTDGVTNGTTTNWNITSSPPRLLHWTDGITAGSTTLDWSNSNRWRKATSGSTSSSSTPIVWGTTPECPPLCQDTVVIDNSSFSSTLDSVLINTPNYQAQVGKFYWRTTTGTNGFGGVPSANLSICDSLYFSPFMANRYRGEIVLKGNPTTAGLLGLKLGSQILRNRLLIDCYHGNTVYNMRDSLYVNAVLVGGFPPVFSTVNDKASLVHNKGVLNTNGNTLNVYSYSSTGNNPRKLIADGSKIRLRGNRGGTQNVGFPQVAWVVANHGATKTYSLSTKNTRFIINTSVSYGSGLLGGGYNYNDVEFYGGDVGRLAVNYSNGFYSSYDPKSPAVVDTFRNIYNNISSSARLVVGPTTLWAGPLYTFTPVYKAVIKNIYNNTSPMDIQGTHCYIDSLECYYRHNTLGIYNISTSNDYYQHWGLYGVTASQQINLAPDSVQWLHNSCDFKPQGSNSNKINFYSNVNGQKTYIRKDSGRVCADWLVMKDIWAIGSGTSLGTITGPGCPTPTVVYKCDWDTLSTFDGTGYGPLTALNNVDPNFTLSKRAWFQGGNGTDFQTNNQGWEKVDRTAVPKMTLSNSSTICEGDTSTIKFELEGPLPYSVNFYSNSNSPAFPAVSNNTLFVNFATPSSYTQTPATATYTTSSSPSGYLYYLVPTNGTAVNAGMPSNPFVLSIKVTPTVTTKYSVGYLVTDKCINNITTTLTALGTATVQVNPRPNPIISVANPGTICSGSPVTYTANAVNGYTYAIYPTATGTTSSIVMTTYSTGTGTNTVANGSLTVSTYTAGLISITYTNYVGATSAYGCVSYPRAMVIVSVNPIPEITNAGQQSICSENTHTVNVINNFTGVTNNWSSPSVLNINGHNNSGTGNAIETLTNTTLSGLSVLYTYTPTSSGCTGTPQTFTLHVDPLPQMTSANTATICSGSPFSILLTNNLPGGSTYQWQATDNTNTTGESTSTQTSTSLGNTIINQNTIPENVIYQVTPTSISGNCIGTPQTITVTVNPAPQMTSANSATICSGNATNLSLVSNVLSSYSWVAADNSNTTGESLTSQTTNTIANTISNSSSTLQNVTYSVTPTSLTGNCLGTTQTITVIVNPLPLVTAVPNPTAICIGQTATLTASGTDSYNWISGPSTVNYTVSPTANQTYTVIGTNILTNCSSTQTASLVVNALPSLTLVASPTELCVGQTSTLTALGADTYAWTSGTSTFNYIVNPTVTQDYTVTGSNTLTTCNNTQTVSVIVNTLPQIQTSQINVSCYGDASGSVTLTPTGGTSGYTITSSTPTNSLSVGNYTYTVIDSKNCSTQTVITIAQPTAVLQSSVSQSTANTSCISPDGAATVTITGGSPNYSVAWSSGTSTTNIGSGLTTGTHQYTVTDNNNCQTSNTVAITGVSGINSTISNQANVLCYGNTTASITISGSGELSNAYNYTLTSTPSPTLMLTNSSGTFNNLSAGTYSVLVQGQNSNCISTNNVSISQPTSSLSILSLVTTSVSCYGGIGTSSITITGGTPSYSVNWENNNSTTSIASYTAGTYTVNVMDANGCVTASQSITINQPVTPLQIASSTQTNITCYGYSNGTASVFITGGTPNYNYTWLPSSTTSTTNIANNLGTGSYTLTITDRNNCVTAQTYTITEPLILTAIISNTTQANCGMANGSASISVSGGTPSYMFDWLTPLTNYTTSIASTNSLQAGTTNLTITDANNCTNTLSIVITNPNAPQIISTATNVACYGNATGAVSTNVSGGSGIYTYTWSTGSNSSFINQQLSGTYTVTVEDSNNCIATATSTITQPISALTLFVNNIVNVSCYGNQTGSAQTSVGGGTPNYTYLWQPINATTPNLTNAGIGNYTITLTDANSCATSSVITISSPSSSLAVSLDHVVQPNCEQKNGEIHVNTAGGTPSYHYHWNTGTITPQLTDISEGSYSIIVTDSLGCKDTLHITIDCKMDLMIPQLFSPNGDGKNDKFEVKTIENYPNNTLTIFNRWGSLVYTKHKYNNEWDGKSNVVGSSGTGILPAGTYYVILDFGDNQTKTYHGFVQLEY